MNFIKKIIKYIYFNFFQKKLKVHFSANLDKHSSYDENSTFKKNTLISSSKIGANVTIQENTVIKRSELADFVAIHNDCKMNGSSVGSYSYVAKSSEISYADVGKFCSIGAEVWIGVGKHPPNLDRG